MGKESVEVTKTVEIKKAKCMQHIVRKFFNYNPT